MDTGHRSGTHWNWEHTEALNATSHALEKDRGCPLHESVHERAGRGPRGDRARGNPECSRSGSSSPTAGVRTVPRAACLGPHGGMCTAPGRPDLHARGVTISLQDGRGTRLTTGLRSDLPTRCSQDRILRPVPCPPRALRLSQWPRGCVYRAQMHLFWGKALYSSGRTARESRSASAAAGGPQGAVAPVMTERLDSTGTGGGRICASVCSTGPFPGHSLCSSGGLTDDRPVPRVCLFSAKVPQDSGGSSTVSVSWAVAWRANRWESHASHDDHDITVTTWWPRANRVLSTWESHTDHVTGTRGSHGRSRGGLLGLIRREACRPPTQSRDEGAIPGWATTQQLGPAAAAPGGSRSPVREEFLLGSGSTCCTASAFRPGRAVRGPCLPAAAPAAATSARSGGGCGLFRRKLLDGRSPGAAVLLQSTGRF